jgi:hypothetical protein
MRDFFSLGVQEDERLLGINSFFHVDNPPACSNEVPNQTEARARKKPKSVIRGG